MPARTKTIVKGQASDRTQQRETKCCSAEKKQNFRFIIILCAQREIKNYCLNACQSAEIDRPGGRVVCVCFSLTHTLARSLAPPWVMCENKIFQQHTTYLTTYARGREIAFISIHRQVAINNMIMFHIHTVYYLGKWFGLCEWNWATFITLGNTYWINEDWDADKVCNCAWVSICKQNIIFSVFFVQERPILDLICLLNNIILQQAEHQLFILLKQFINLFHKFFMKF